MIALGFDFDHTLGVDNGLERKAMYAYADELGRPLDPLDAAWRRSLEDLLAAFRAGDIARGDVGGALAAGLRAVWFNREEQSYPQDLPPPTLIVESLGELQAWVENTIAP